MDDNGEVPYLPGVSENSIYICGYEEQLGDDVRFIASDIFSVSEVTYDEENDNYHVTFSKDNVSITYSIYYYQNADFHYVNGVRDAYNEIQVDGIDGVNHGIIRIVGKNPELGNTLEIITNSEYDVEYEVDYDVAETSDFDAVIRVTHDGAEYNYYVYYVADL